MLQILLMRLLIPLLLNVLLLPLMLLNRRVRVLRGAAMRHRLRVKLIALTPILRLLMIFMSCLRIIMGSVILKRLVSSPIPRLLLLQR